jgi:phosphomethylpyrimidine synthase
MKITQDVREYARSHRVDEQKALEEGMQEKAREFLDQGGEIYREV